MVIDDFFCLAEVDANSIPQDGTQNGYSPAKEAFDKAKDVYAREGLRGSDAKDIIDSVKTTVVGAEVNSSHELLDSGLLTVGAPAGKRLALSWVCLETAGMAYTSDALHSSLIGSLISAFCFRRCSMSILNQVFQTIPPEELDTAHPRLHPLSRAASEELVLASVLLPVLATNIQSEVVTKIFASDASNEKGAFCEAQVSSAVATALWQSGDFKGGYTTLEPFAKTFLRRAEDVEEDGLADILDDEGWVLPDPTHENSQHVARPLAQYFDFIEFCGGSGVLLVMR